MSPAHQDYRICSYLRHVSIASARRSHPEPVNDNVFFNELCRHPVWQASVRPKSHLFRHAFSTSV